MIGTLVKAASWNQVKLHLLVPKKEGNTYGRTMWYVVLSYKIFVKHELFDKLSANTVMPVVTKSIT